MNVDPKDDLDRAIDEALASMVQGEPRRVSGASVRQAAGESGGFRLPVWLAVVAILIVGLGVFVNRRHRVALPSASVARSTEPRAPVEASPTPSPGASPAERVALTASAASKRVQVQTTTEPRYEGLPRLAIASIADPEPLRPDALDPRPIQIPGIDIAPLSIPGLSDQPEHK